MLKDVLTHRFYGYVLAFINEKILSSIFSKIDIEKFQAEIMAWYLLNGRQFLWRREGLSDYEIIIAEVLLQRTKAETVEKFYKGFLLRYPDWKSITNSTLEMLEDALKSIGLYRQRAKRLMNLAIEMDKRLGVIPDNRFELDEISMFGQYIANAVELQIFNRSKPLLDVNMARVLERYFEQRKLADIRYDPFLQNLAHQVVNHENSKLISWAILDFAAIICKSRNPMCIICSLSVNCKYYKLIKNK